MLLLMFAAMLITAGLCVALIPAARRVGLVDHPGERKVHENSTPLTGGPALLIVSGLALLYLGKDDPFLQGLALGGLVMFVVGIIDDLRPLSASLRFVAQIFACLIILVYTGVRLDDFGMLIYDWTLTLGWMSVPVTIFAAMGVINSFNMIDGMDGLAGSIFLVAAGGTALLAVPGRHFALIVLLLVAFAAVFGYLLLNARFPWNERARVFMGDSGSTLLGFFLAWCFIALGNDHNDTGARAFAPMTAVWLFAVPLLDTTTLMWRRWQAGESAFMADQHHLHHAFLRAGFSVGQTWFGITALALVLAAAGIAFERSSLPEYYSFWTFIGFALFYHFHMKRSWSLQRFLGRDFIYNEFDNPNSA